MELRDIIKDYRIKHGLTMQAFADSCKLSKGYISMLESGKHPNNERQLVPSLETYKKLSSGMGMDLDTLLKMVDGDSVVSLKKEAYPLDVQYFADKPFDDKHRRLIQFFDSLPSNAQDLILAQLEGAALSQKDQDNQ